MNKTLDTRATAKWVSWSLIRSDGKGAAEFITFPDTEARGHYFGKGQREGIWNAVLQPYLVQDLRKGKAGMNFDTKITRMLFDKGKTRLGIFKGGFLADFEDKLDSPEHTLFKIGTKAHTRAQGSAGSFQALIGAVRQ
ncbi:hypothetical protein DFH09DRAFT_1327827 [Mycena vulgaris]|nr:hypothetical protein DFH09DRAFT_1327827 [Mycena vulgaris]